MRTIETRSIFYVYEHWRPDRDICFWVGKGYGNRAYDFTRNRHYNDVVQRLSRLGMCVEVRLVQSGMTEDAALSLEKERIAFWRRLGVNLTNRTAGGQGVSGLRHSEETRAKIKAKRKLQKMQHSDDTKRKIGAANAIALKGRKNPEHSARMVGRKLSEEHRVKIGQGGKGRVHSAETREKMSRSNSGKKRSPETRERLRLSHLGKVLSSEVRQRMSDAQRARWARRKEIV